MLDWMRDVRIGFRTLFARPGFAVVAILTLGVGIGANTAIYTVVQAVLLRPLPFPDADRLVRLWETAERDELELRSLSFPILSDFEAADEIFEAVAARSRLAMNLGSDDEPARILGEAATPGYFEMFGMTPAVGRFFDPTDEAVVVLSEPLWRQRFGGAADIVGRSVEVNEVSATVIGVASGPSLSGDVDLWIPLRRLSDFVGGVGESWFERRGRRWLSAVARLQPGVTPAVLEAWLSRETSRLRRDHPEVMENRGVTAEPLDEQILGDVQQTATLLMISVGLVMLIVCANLANLLLARGVDRRREVALRLAIGATRGRVVRQLLIESFLLASLGGVVGLMLALWTSDLLRQASLFEDLPSYVVPSIDVETLLFTGALAVVTSLLFGAVPALVAARSGLSGTLKGERPSASLGIVSGRGVLVSLQVALAVLLTAASGLMIRSLTNQLEIDPGFQTEGLHTLRIQLPPRRYDADQALGFTRRLEERLLSVPGVRRVALGTDVPLVDGYSAQTIAIEDRVRAGLDDRMRVYSHRVSPGFLKTMGISLRAGRDVGWLDGSEAPLVVLVSEKLARRAWPDESPLDKRVRTGGEDSPWRTVVGVVADVRYRELVLDPVSSPDDPDFYVPLGQAASRDLGIVLDTGVAGAPDMANIRAELRALDPGVPVFAAQSMAEVLERELALPRAATWLSSLFGVVAVFLAGLGLYGVLAQLVAQRSREIGIRIALGARSLQVIRRIVGNGLGLVASGLVVGLIAAALVGRALESRLFDVSGTDPRTLGAAALVLFVVALVATFIPAHRASRVDPITALRED